MLPIREQLSKFVLKKTQMKFDATSFTSLYPSAMWDIDSVFPKIETGYTFKPYMNDMFVNDFNSKLSIKMVMTQHVQKKILHWTEYNI